MPGALKATLTGRASRLPLLGCPEPIRLPTTRLHTRRSHSAQGLSHHLGALFTSWPCQVSAR